jgi:hypothetical protein
VKVNVEHALEIPTPYGSSISAANFDRFEWDIMYPLFSSRGSR